MPHKTEFTFLIACLGVLQTFVDGECLIPDYFRAKYFSTDLTTELFTTITTTTFSNEQLGTSHCIHLVLIPGSDDSGNISARILFHNREANCFQCQDIYFRTPNVLQHRFSACVNKPNGNVEMLHKSVCQDISPNMDYQTLFRIDLLTVNCKETFEGCFHYTYEVNFGGGSICDSPRNTINACQMPGSVYVDNQVFDMSSGACEEVTGSFNSKTRFQCMGSWTDEKGNLYSAISDMGAVKNRERFRCLLTRKDQEIEDNKLRFSLSRWASCAVLKTPYEGDIRLILEPMMFDQIPLLEAGCRFPRNFTGNFYMGGELDHYITINTTHLYMKTILNQYQIQKSFFTCIAKAGGRYLTFHMDEGKCETHFVCFDFLQRHQNIIRFRTSKPVPTRLDLLSLPHYLENVFRHACAWSTFTFERTHEPQEWIYNYFIMDPPAPVTCPIGGRYKFVQEGDNDEMYKTEVLNAYTDRPRHMVDCTDDTSELRSCDYNRYKFLIDVSYCATLDHTGKPIGEYEIADRMLICVGFWMENMKSFLITYDWQDPISSFRCWVYERTTWRNITMSRSTNAHCGVSQTAFSDSVAEGSSLRVLLSENERLWDSCSQSYDTGENPWKATLEIFIVDGKAAASKHHFPYVMSCFCIFSRLCLRLLL